MSVVKIRFSGEGGDVRRTIAAMRRGGARILHVSRPYPNRREPGVRVYAEVDGLTEEGGAR